MTCGNVLSFQDGVDSSLFFLGGSGSGASTSTQTRGMGSFLEESEFAVKEI